MKHLVHFCNLETSALNPGQLLLLGIFLENTLLAGFCVFFQVI